MPVPMQQGLSCSLLGQIPGPRPTRGPSSGLWSPGSLAAKFWLPPLGRPLLLAACHVRSPRCSPAAAAAAADTLRGYPTQDLSTALRGPLAPRRWPPPISSPAPTETSFGGPHRSLSHWSGARVAARGDVSSGQLGGAPLGLPHGNVLLEGLSEEQRDAVVAGPGHVR